MLTRNQSMLLGMTQGFNIYADLLQPQCYIKTDISYCAGSYPSWTLQLPSFLFWFYIALIHSLLPFKHVIEGGAGQALSLGLWGASGPLLELYFYRQFEVEEGDCQLDKLLVWHRLCVTNLLWHARYASAESSLGHGSRISIGNHCCT